MTSKGGKTNETGNPAATFVVRLVMRLKYIKTGTRRIMRLGELSFEIRLERRTTKGSSSGCIMRLVPVFILETHNQTNYKMFVQVRQEG